MGVPGRKAGSLRWRAEQSPAVRGLTVPAARFIHTEGATGLLMILAATAAMLWLNLGGTSSYENVWKTPLHFQVGEFFIRHDLRHWINDFLMAFFFYAIGLEIKYEFVHGELGSFRTAIVPVVAAVGGMVVPVGLYLALNPAGEAARGWGVPMATDIAFALAALSLLGNRVPSQLKVLLLTLAVIDDIGAILVIAIFYSSSISWPALAVAAGILAVILVMRTFKIDNVGLYTVAALSLWVSVYLSGVHATIAGVVLGLVTRAKEQLQVEEFTQRAETQLEAIKKAHHEGDTTEAERSLGELEQLTRTTESPLEWGARVLHPISGYLILPLFALANAGIPLGLSTLQAAAESPIAWGIGLGLVVGKPVGIFGFGALAMLSRVGRLPGRLGWLDLLALGFLGAIGFTVAIFIATLAFSQDQTVEVAKVGILVASLVAPIAGLGLARWSSARRNHSEPQPGSESG